MYDLASIIVTHCGYYPYFGFPSFQVNKQMGNTIDGPVAIEVGEMQIIAVYPCTTEIYSMFARSQKNIHHGKGVRLSSCYLERLHQSIYSSLERRILL